jgi:hypothetical protein
MKHVSAPNRSRRCVNAALCLVTAALLSGGCNWLGYIGQTFRGDHEKADITAQYTDLADKSVAVMVAGDEYTLSQYPLASERICRAVSARIADNLPSASLMDPQQVIAYQEANPYWFMVSASQLLEAMKVDRIVKIELADYRTHEPGNAHVWQGLVSGDVYVLEVDAEDPNQPALYTRITARFPETTKVGVLNSDDELIEMGMCSIFSRDAGGLFYDHTIVRQ